jgi:hypothetical protein
MSLKIVLLIRPLQSWKMKMGRWSCHRLNWVNFVGILPKVIQKNGK